jgi:hypothetical protein
MELDTRKNESQRERKKGKKMKNGNFATINHPEQRERSTKIFSSTRRQE